MVGVAQLVERRIVIPVVVGSIPIVHPILWHSKGSMPFEYQIKAAPVAQLDRASAF